MRINVFSGKLARLHTEVLIVSFFEDIRPLRGLAGEIDWLYGGAFSNLLIRKHLTGKRGELALLATQDKLQISKVILVGLGSSASYRASELNALSQNLFHSIAALHVRECAVELPVPLRSEDDLLLSIESFLKGFDQKKKNEPFELIFVVQDGEKARMAQQRIKNGGYLGRDPHPETGSSSEKVETGRKK